MRWRVGRVEEAASVLKTDDYPVGLDGPAQWASVLGSLPGTAPLHRAPPVRLHRVGLVPGDRRLELAIQLPQLGEVAIAPDAGAKACQKSRAQCRGLRVPRPADRDAEQVRLQLAEHIHHRRASVD